MRVLQMGRLGAGHLPVIFAILFTAMLGTTYVFAVWHGDVDPVFPYISTSGDSRPESCVFSGFLNISSFMSILIIYLRYSLVVELNRSSDLLLKDVNRVALYTGLLGALGMFIVANFQETAVIQIHLTGAFMCFGFGCLYMLLQTWVSYRMHPLFVNRRIAYIRGSIALLSSICFVLAVVLGVMASNTFHKYFPDVPSPRPWRQHNPPLPGYDLHCISAVAEWTCAVLNVGFLLSYSRDFEKIRVQLGVQPLVAHLDHSPLWHSSSDLASP